MAKPFGYEIGFVKYVLMSMLFNAVPMYIFGGGVRAAFEALTHGYNSGFIAGVLNYFITKYLPPTSLSQIVVQIGMGAVVAGGLWYLKTPRQGSRASG